MTWLAGGLVASGAACALMNATTTRKLWSGPVFEPSQKIIQTALIWIVPGSFAIVRHLLSDSRPSARVADPTVGTGSYEADASFISHGNDHGGGHDSH